MQSNPFFSLIIPVYNTEKYLRDCINSILNQTFKNFQLILVDDGSTDNSPKICDEYKQLYNEKIVVIHKYNEGQLASRLKGLELAKGRYIYYVDSDDTICPNLLKEVYDIIQKYNSDVVIFKWQYINEEGDFVKSIEGVFPEGIVDKEIIINELIKDYCLNSLCIKVVKRGLFNCDIDFNKYFFIKNGEDLIESLPVIKNANIFFYLDKPYYNYRINTKSITKTFNKIEFFPLIYIRPLVYSYLIELSSDYFKYKKNYYNFNFYSLWEKLYRYFTLCKDKNYDEDLSLLYSHTIKYRNWLRQINLQLYIKIAILLFYWKQWILLDMYYFFIHVFYICGKKIKDKLIVLKLLNF